MTERETAEAIIKNGGCFNNNDIICTNCPVDMHPECPGAEILYCIQWLKDHPEETTAESLKNVGLEKVFENTEGQKHDNGKLDYTLLPFDALKEVVKVLEFGKRKYARDNWQKVEPKERYLQAAFRHVVAYAQGEKLDEESGLSHLAHAVCCLLFLIWKEKES